MPALFESVKLPDLLKATAPQAFALSAACLLVLYLSHVGVVPKLQPWMVLLTSFVAIFSGILWGVLLTLALWKFSDPAGRWRRWRARRARQKAVADYIPYMTQEEREIIGCLLARNQKTFSSDVDGGSAASLISRGIIVNGLRPGQVFDFNRVPMRIPDDVWSVLEAHRQEFPKYAGEGDPWRIHWMAR